MFWSATEKFRATPLVEDGVRPAAAKRGPTMTMAGPRFGPILAKLGLRVSHQHRETNSHKARPTLAKCCKHRANVGRAGKEMAPDLRSSPSPSSANIGPTPVEAGSGLQPPSGEGARAATPRPKFGECGCSLLHQQRGAKFGRAWSKSALMWPKSAKIGPMPIELSQNEVEFESNVGQGRWPDVGQLRRINAQIRDRLGPSPNEFAPRSSLD